MTDFECEEAAAANGIAATCTLDDHERDRWITYRPPLSPAATGVRGRSHTRSWTVCVGTKMALLRAEAKAKGRLLKARE